MDDRAATRADVTSAIGALGEAIDRRWDDQLRVSSERHSENVTRLVRIEDEVRRTNGRVTRTEEQIRTLFRHPSEHPKKAIPPTSQTSDAIDRRFTQRDLAMFLAGGGALIGAWRFAEWAFHLLQVRP